MSSLLASGCISVVTAVWFRLRAEGRVRWRSWLGLMVLVGVSGGATLALAAGARRTDSAYPRLVEAQRSYDAVVFDRGLGGDVDVPPDFLDRVARLPQVAESGRFRTLFDSGGRTSDGRLIGEPDYLNTVIPADAAATVIRARQKLLDGRHPDPTAADEVAVNFTVAERYDLDVGDRMELDLFTGEQLLRLEEEGVQPRAVQYRFRVVGIFAGAGDFPPRTLGDGAGFVDLSRAFLENGSEFAPLTGLVVRLAGGAEDQAALRRGIEAIIDGPADSVATFGQADQHAATERSIHVLAVGLWVFAALAATAATLVVGQSLVRTAMVDAADYPTLQALGLSRRQLVVLGLGRAAVIAIGGAVLAVLAAVVLSPLFPLGLARTAEPDPGLALDGLVLFVGGGALGLVVMALGLLAAWRSVRSTAGSGVETAEVRISRLAVWLAQGGFPPPAVAGVRMALVPGQGARAVPARSTLVGAVLGVAAISAALTFGRGLEHLLASPPLYGWNWDVTVGDGYDLDVFDEVVPALRDEPSIEAFGAGTFGAVTVEGREIFVMATDAMEGAIGPTVTEGRAPAAPDEILLGGATMDRLGVSIGETVSVRYLGTFNGEATKAHEARPLAVVGQGVLPAQSDIGLDDAGAVTFEGLSRLAPGEQINRNFFPVRFAEGVSQEEGLGRLRRSVDHYTVPVQRPTDLVNFGRVDALPVLGAGLLGLISVAMLTHLLLSSVRRRRRDLALLKVLGLTRGQVRLTVVWQVTTLAVVALVVGLPLGTAAGRWAWTVAADRLGVLVEPVVPIAVLALLVPFTVLVVNAAATLPARFAARTRPAVLLRAD